jgi:hypothetical protein
MNVDLTEKEGKFILKLLKYNYAETEEDFEGIGMGSENPVLKSLDRKLRKFEDYDEDRRSYLEERLTFGMLFCGAGYRTGIACNQMHKRLDYAIMTLGGMQQNGGMGSDFDEESDKQGHEDIKNVLKDLLIAFDISAEELIEPKLEFDI